MTDVRPGDLVIAAVGSEEKLELWDEHFQSTTLRSKVTAKVSYHEVALVVAQLGPEVLVLTTSGAYGWQRTTYLQALNAG